MRTWRRRQDAEYKMLKLILATYTVAIRGYSAFAARSNISSIVEALAGIGTLEGADAHSTAETHLLISTCRLTSPAGLLNVLQDALLEI